MQEDLRDQVGATSASIPVDANRCASSVCESLPSTRPSHRGIRRTLGQVDFVPAERDWHAAESEALANSNLEEMQLFNPIAFIAQVKITLGDARDLLGSKQLASCNEVLVMLRTVRARVDQIVKLSRAITLDDKCRDVRTLIASQITDKDAYASYNPEEGLQQWCERVGEELLQQKSWGAEYEEVFLSDLAEEMESQASKLSFCLEVVDEILTGEDVSYLWS